MIKGDRAAEDPAGGEARTVRAGRPAAGDARWVPAGLDPAAAAPGAEPVSWIAEERILRTRRLSRELSDWLGELRARSAAIDSRLRDGESSR